jgi:rsbT co-antagonist protein RsbR
VDIRESDAGASAATINEALRSENATLRARIAELEQAHGSPSPAGIEPARDGLDLQQSQTLLHAIMENSAAVIFVKDMEGRYITINRRWEELFHVTLAQVRGKTDHELFPPQVAKEIRDNDLAVLTTGTPIRLEERVPADGKMHVYVSIKFPIRDAAGKITAVCGIATDITDLKEAEEARSALQAQIIEASRTSLRELSTPLIPLAEGVLVMPIIGTVDSMRADHIMHALLEGITVHAARLAILDITGVKVVDTQVANALIQAAQAGRLLGAEIVLTGIGPHVATALIGLGVDLGNLKTLGTLRAGVTYALRHGQ